MSGGAFRHGGGILPGILPMSQHGRRAGGQVFPRQGDKLTRERLVPQPAVDARMGNLTGTRALIDLVAA